MDRRLAAILAADVVGYSRLMGENEEDTQQRLRAYLEKIKELSEKHRGRVFGAFGDAVIVEFASPVESLRSAIEIQNHMRDVNEALPADRRMLIRIGINLGDVLVEQDNLYGDGVNIAARLEGLAPPGGVAISEEVFRLVHRKLDCTFQDGGQMRVKNIDDPVHVYYVAERGNAEPGWDVALPRPASLVALPASKPRTAAAWRVAIAGALALLAGLYFAQDIRPTRDDVTPGNKISIAVLPIKNLSADPDQQYISDGFTNDIITDLSKFDELYVPSSHSSYFYEGRAEPLEDIAAALRVRYILEGSLQKDNRTLRINAQLIDARSGSHVWADRYSYPEVNDLFAIQDSIVDQVVNKIVANINPEKLALVTHSVRTTDMEAQELYWKGVQVFGDECEFKEVCDESRDLFEQAIAKDENFARAHGWLAYVIAQGWYHDFYDASELETAKAHALKAVELDGGDFENHWSLGEVEHRMGDMDDAYTSFVQAIELNGNDANLLANWSEILNKRGEQKEALKAINKAIALSPVDTPDYFYWNKAYIEYFMKDHNASLASLDKMKAKPIWAGSLRAADLARLGKSAEAQQEMTLFLTSTDGEGPWSLSTEYDTEASSFARQEDAIYWLEGLKMAGLPRGEDLPADVSKRLFAEPGQEAAPDATGKAAQ